MVPRFIRSATFLYSPNNNGRPSAGAAVLFLLAVAFLVAVFFVLLSFFAMMSDVNLCGFAPVVRRVAVGH